MTALLVAAGLLVLLSAFLSVAETALFSVSEFRLRTLVEEGFSGADSLRDLREEPSTIQSALLLLNGIANLLAVGLLVAAVALRWSAPGAVGGVVVGVVLVLVLGEVIPRAAAAGRPVRLALAIAPRLTRLDLVMRPVLEPVARLEGLLAPRPRPLPHETPEEREVREIARLGQEEGVVGEEEHHLVERAFRLDELTAFDVMTPRVEMFAWQDTLTLEEIVDELERVPYSRVPVYGENIDDISGILYVRGAYETYVAGRCDTPLHRIAREPMFVPASLSLARLLRDFQARRMHMGIVADEYGGTDGLVTLEDVLEELVGEIVDETDVAEEPLLRISRNEIVAAGGVDLREINFRFNVSLPQLEHRSLNGFILEELGYVPEKGEELEIEGLRIEVLEATDTQVTRVRLRRLTPEVREEA